MNTKKMRSLKMKVSGVSFEGRQAYLAKLLYSDPVRLVPEPDNKYDPNAIKVLVAHGDEILHVGYVPRELASEVAPFLDGENVDGYIVELTGGFSIGDGEIANYGLIVAFDIPIS